MKYCDSELYYNYNENTSLAYNPILEASNYFYNNDIIYERGDLIRNCSFALSDEILESCLGDDFLIRSSCILEGAKMDFLLKNFLNEGKDYKGLKKDLKEIIRANDLDKDKLRTGKDGFMHICKRILQISYDLCIPIGTVTGVVNLANLSQYNGAMASIFGTSATSAVAQTILGGIIGFVLGFIINRLIRYCVDTVEFNTLKKDCDDILDQLEDMARKCKNPKQAEKYRKEAKRLEDAIKKYSK